MTLILTLGNRQQIIQLSDRRLTWNGKLVDDESNKAIILRSVDARLVIGFTGLARASSFETERWLIETLTNAGHPDYKAETYIEHLKEKATNAFQTFPAIRRLPARDRRLTIMCTGYLYKEEGTSPLMVYATLTNYQDFSSGKDDLEAWDYFKVFYGMEKPEVEGYCDYVQRVGAWQVMTEADEKTLRQMLAEGKPAKAILGKGVDLMIEMADRPKAKGVIGKQISSVILPSDPSMPATPNYHSDVAKGTIYQPSLIIAQGDKAPTIAMRNVRLFIGEEGSNNPALVVPKARPNQPCPCGSGKKYKKCHGEHARSTR